ncbi:hypothetical protein ACS5PU_12140 [Pedobacter sp. GSP4]
MPRNLDNISASVHDSPQPDGPVSFSFWIYLIDAPDKVLYIRGVVFG